MYDPEMRKDCPMRGTLGNCSPVGGFCLDAVSDEICEAVHNAYDHGFYNAIKTLKEQELPTELKQKMWNAFYAEEDEYEKKFVGSEEHLNWFMVYRPWLQKGFDITINAIADWEGR